MKKMFILACMALSGLCASAQEKGDFAFGLNFSASPCLESGASLTNLGIGAKLQYNVSNPVRLEAAFDYGFKDKGFDVMTVGINGHYIFKAGEKFNIYPLAGVGYARIGVGEGKYSISSSEFYFNVGAGAEYAFSDKFAVGVEVKYQYIDNFSRLPISIGASYKF